MDLIESVKSEDDLFEDLGVDNGGLLPADHPLLERFQRALKEHLLKVKSQLETEIVDLDHSIKAKDEEITEVGSKLFDLQNDIEIQRDQIDKYNRNILEMSDKRKAHEDNVLRLKHEFNVKDSSCKDKKRIQNELTQEIGNMQVLENEIAKWNEEIQNEVVLAKRISSKDSKNQLGISEEKKKMDLILFKLDSEVRKNERELANIDDQVKEHGDSVASLNKNLADANTDLEGLQQEHKKLMQAWGEVIVSVQQRDKVLAKAKTEIFNEHEQHKNLQASIENTRKFIQKELETSEKLNEFKNRLLRDMTNIEKHVQVAEGENIKLDQKLDQFGSILEKTEISLEEARSEGLLTKNHLTKLLNKLEKQGREKYEIEEKILELLQDQITTDKAGKHRGKLLREAQENRRRMEISMSQTENQLSITLLDLEKWRGLVQRAKENVERVKTDHNEADYEATTVNEEIEKLKLAVKTKLITLDTMHKQLDQMIAATGGKELNLKEFYVVEMEKKIAELDDKIKESQQFWMRLQSMVVGLSEKRAQQMDDIFVGRKQLMVIEQKAIKVEIDLEQSQNEHREIIRSLSNLNVKLDSTSAKLYEKRKVHDKDEVECELAHQDTIEKLRNAEMSVLALEQDLNDMGREIEELKNHVVERHYEALSWETKFKMASEAKKLHDDELAKTSEIGIMKSEIHRMEVKYGQLKKVQERMVQELENSVYHRDHIYDAAYTREKKTGSKIKTQSNIKHKMNEMQNKLKIISSDLNTTQRQFNEVQRREEEIKSEINIKEQDVQSERMQDCLLQTEIEQSMLLKHQNLEGIIKRQKRAKRYKVLQACTYLPKLKSEPTIVCELHRQEEIHENLIGILESLQRDFPSHKFPIERIYQTLKN